MNNEKEQNVKEKKPSKPKYIITAACVVLLIIALVFAALRWEPKPDPASEKIIREAVAKQLKKDPNELTDEDFAKVTRFTLGYKELCDIKLLEKFKNLEGLDLYAISYPENAIPKWIKILAKMGFYDINERFAIDLSPIKNLTSIKYLVLRSSSISDITPLEILINLETLDIACTRVSDLEPLRGLTNLRTLVIFRTQVSSLEPIKNLTNLQRINFDNTKISDLKPIKNLKNLRTISIGADLVSGLELIKEFKNLEYLFISSSNNITNQQITDIEKALLKVEIFRPAE